MDKVVFVDVMTSMANFLFKFLRKLILRLYREYIMRKSLLRLFILSSPLLLGACGEGWEFQKTDTVFPYGNQRTAGSGVAYVRAKMLPEKELKIEPVVQEVQAPVEEEVKPVLDAEEIFTEAQTKGGSTAVEKTLTKEVHESAVEVKTPSVASSENITPESSSDKVKDNKLDVELDMEKEDHSSNSYELKSGMVDNIEKSAELETPDLGAEEYIAEPPKDIAVLDAEFIDVEPEAGGSSVAGEDGLEIVDIYENKVAQPIKEIVVPKKDFFDFKSEGQISLDEIYSDPFVEGDF